jgi:hypothetical protein
MRRIPELLLIVRAALSAVTVCSPMLLRARPRTALRVFCIAAFEYLARLEGSTLGSQRRLAIAHACDFGSLRDEYYDQQKLDLTEYRLLRSALRRIAPEEATSSYIQQLRKAERGRPILSPGSQEIAIATSAYRATVIDLSLRWMQRLSGLAVDRVKFHSLLSLVCLMQLVDDLLDWKEDYADGNPSYVTAFLLEQPRSRIATPLRAQADALLHSTFASGRQDAGALPFALAGVVTWTLVLALIKVRFPK